MSDERQDPPGQPSCGEAPPYVLGLLQTDAAEQFLRHAEGCVVCRDEIAALVPAIDALAESVPPLRAPRPLRGRVLATVRAEAAAKQTIAGAPARRRGWYGEQARHWRPRRLALVASSTATLAIGCALGALVIASPSSGSPKTVTLSAQVRVRGASAKLHRSGSHTWLTVSGMPQPGGDHVYEVWLMSGGGDAAPEPTSALFTPTSSGAATVAVPGSLRGVSEVLVTAEPAGGSLSPTEEPLIVARVA